MDSTMTHHTGCGSRSGTATDSLVAVASDAALRPKVRPEPRPARYQIRARFSSAWTSACNTGSYSRSPSPSATIVPAL